MCGLQGRLQSELLTHTCMRDTTIILEVCISMLETTSVVSNDFFNIIIHVNIYVNIYISFCWTSYFGPL